MRRHRSNDNQHLRRRKRQQRRGAPNPMHYTECSLTNPSNRKEDHDRNRR